jgi:ATP-dependent RNA helicase RhlE
MSFADLRLAEPILRAVASEGYDVPTPIQAQAIPHVRDGSDLLGCAQTGTGKTAAFALPILHRLLEVKGDAAPAEGAHPKKPARHKARVIRALILSPTRELAQQIADSFKAYGKHCGLRGSVIYGGVSQHAQTQALDAGVDIVVATPGRLHDLIAQGYVDLSHVEIFVLDEADRMLDMGFIDPIRKVVALLPKKRQTLMFSATMPKEIRQLANSILHNPVNIEVAPVATAAELVDQAVYFVEKKNKPALLLHFLEHTSVTRTLIFTRTKYGADHVAKFLNREGLRAETIHGDKSQGQRQRALANFKANKTPILVATDIAARGLDVDNISHVVNFDVPHEPETYVHRIGRTGRAGATGDAVSFCMYEERSYLGSIERLMKREVRVIEEHPYKDTTPVRQSRHEGSSHGGRSFRAKPQHGGFKSHGSGGTAKGGHAGGHAKPQAAAHGGKKAHLGQGAGAGAAQAGKTKKSGPFRSRRVK